MKCKMSTIVFICLVNLTGASEQVQAEEPLLNGGRVAGEITVRSFENLFPMHQTTSEQSPRR